MVVLLPGSGGLRTNGREVPPSGLKPNILTRGLAPHPPRPALPQPMALGARGAKRFL
jgi:hypothetical protein